MSLQTDYLWTGRVVRLEPFVLSLPEPLRCACHIARVESAEPFVLSLSKHSCRAYRSTLWEGHLSRIAIG